MRNARKEVVARAVSRVIQRPTGIVGLDQLLRGGLPEGRTTLVAGGPGCGKTLLALETLVHGARDHDEPGIFVALEEGAEHVIANAATLGWNLPQLQKKRLFFLDARLPSSVIHDGAFDLQALLAGLDERCRTMGARRVVFDGINELLLLLNDPAAERREMYRLSEWLTNRKLTGIVTCKIDHRSGFSSERDSYLQYLSDCVVFLEHRPTGAVPLRRLRILKCRGIHHQTSEVPFAITGNGLDVAAPPLPATLGPQATTERISAGVARLDTMLLGGYYRGASILLSGAPGTAKSTLAAAFAAAAARRKERTLYVTFDETPDRVIRNMRSVNIDLAKHVRSGALRIVAGYRATRSAIDDVAWIVAEAGRHRARCLVVDPLTALVSGGGALIGEEAATHLLRFAQANGITLLSTSLLSGVDALGEATSIGISTLADTWIHLSYVARAGERNRALTIVKSRGVGHSNQVRELVLSNKGIALADVFFADGDVLMGTLRWQKENEARLVHDQQRRDHARLAHDAAAEVAETKTSLARLTQELKRQEAALQDLVASSERTLQSGRRTTATIAKMRAGDAPAGMHRAGTSSHRRLA